MQLDWVGLTCYAATSLYLNQQFLNEVYKKEMAKAGKTWAMLSQIDIFLVR